MTTLNTAHGPRTTPLPHSCQCERRWSGANTAHCAACHETFTGVEGFDYHRRGGQCGRPEQLGMAVGEGRAYPCWAMPQRPPAPQG